MNMFICLNIYIYNINIHLLTILIKIINKYINSKYNKKMDNKRINYKELLDDIIHIILFWEI